MVMAGFQDGCGGGGHHSFMDDYCMWKWQQTEASGLVKNMHYQIIPKSLLPECLLPVCVCV